MKNLNLKHICALSFVSVLTLSATSFATSMPSLKFLPGLTLEQKQERDYLERGLFKDALDHWTSSLGMTSFSTTPTGEALHALLLFENKGELLGLHELFEIKDPTQIAKEIRDLWKAEAPASSSAWTISNVKWDRKWNAVFSPSVESALEAWNTEGLQNKASVKKAEALLARLDKNSPQRSWIEWQLASKYAVDGDTKTASRYLGSILENEHSVIDTDEIALATARMLYQDGKLNAALNTYSKVSKNSDFWIEAMEERAWAKLRLNDYDGALSELKTVLAPVFRAQTGPEPLFLESLIYLKVCDFYRVFQTLNDFKARFRNKIVELEALSKSGSTPASQKAIASWEQNGVIKGSDDDLQKLPKLLEKDYYLKRSVLISRKLKAEEPMASLDMVSWLKSSKSDAQSRITSRLKQLAANDLDETQNILRKLNLVDIEAIQRTHVDHKLSDYKQKPDAKGQVLKFPDEGEVWMDELTHYNVSAKECFGQSHGGKQL